MGAGTGERAARVEGVADGHARRPAIAPGTPVVLRRPWRLRGRTAIVQRRLPNGWEVEVRSALGTPLHLVVRRRWMRVVGRR